MILCTDALVFVSLFGLITKLSSSKQAAKTTLTDLEWLTMRFKWVPVRVPISMSFLVKHFRTSVFHKPKKLNAGCGDKVDVEIKVCQCADGLMEV